MTCPPPPPPPSPHPISATPALVFPCRFFSAKKDFAALVRSLPLEVMMPVNSGLTLMLPTSDCTERQHQPFAEVVTIADIKDEVELLMSLQRPKKVCLCICTVEMGYTHACWFVGGTADEFRSTYCSAYPNCSTVTAPAGPTLN